MAAPTPLEILAALVRVSDPMHPANVARRERDARIALADLQAKYQADYREMATEIRVRYGREPEQSESEYVERRLGELCERLGIKAE